MNNMNITLRPWETSDLADLVKYANNRNIAKNLTDKFPFPYSEQSGMAFIEMISQHNPVQVFAIDIKGEAIGSIGLHPQDDIHRQNAEMGYWLAEPYWGKGIISNAIKQIVDYGFANFDINRIFARPFGSNIASQKVLEKNAFVLEARFEKVLIKNGDLEDELIYAIRRS